MTSENNLDDIPRRGFLKVAIALLNGAIALLVTVPGLGYLLTPVFRKGNDSWISLGSVDNFQRTEPQKATFNYVSESGYTQKEKSGFVWVIADDSVPEKVSVLSAICTHTGCNVTWQSEEGEFECPCHGGKYNRQGEVVAGPPPKPLERLPLKIENGEVAIQLPS